MNNLNTNLLNTYHQHLTERETQRGAIITILNSFSPPEKTTTATLEASFHITNGQCDPNGVAYDYAQCEANARQTLAEATEHTNVAIAYMLAKGATITAISQATGLSRTTLHKRLKPFLENREEILAKAEAFEPVIEMVTLEE